MTRIFLKYKILQWSRLKSRSDLIYCPRVLLGFLEVLSVEIVYFLLLSHEVWWQLTFISRGFVTLFIGIKYLDISTVFLRWAVFFIFSRQIIDLCKFSPFPLVESYDYYLRNKEFDAAKVQLLKFLYLWMRSKSSGDPHTIK